MENKTSIKELNAILKGEHMAIDSYDRYIEKVQDKNIKENLQSIQQDHKLHSILISERIQDLGGSPTKGAGVIGTMSEAKNAAVDLIKHNDAYYIEEAKNGEDLGIRMSREVVKGDLDEESMNLIQGILDTDDIHVQELDNMLHKLRSGSSMS